MNLVATINIRDNNKEGWDKSLNSIESIRWASQRWGADYFELTSLKYKEYNPEALRKVGTWNGFAGTKMWQVIWLLENFQHYDKIAILDTDITINQNCPSIFEELGEHEVAAALDGNPGRMPHKGDYFKNSISRHNAFGGNTAKYMEEFEGFNPDKFFETYINSGVIVYDLKKIGEKVQALKELILTKGKLWDYINEAEACIDQSIQSAWFTFCGFDIKYLDNTWNWVAPECIEEWESMYLTPHQIPNIYHFCGANLTKERGWVYDGWKGGNRRY